MVKISTSVGPGTLALQLRRLQEALRAKRETVDLQGEDPRMEMGNIWETYGKHMGWKWMDTELFYMDVDG